MPKISLVILAIAFVLAVLWGIGEYLGHRGEKRGDITRGQAVAEQTCLRCHTRFDDEPHPNPDAQSAPPLASFGQRWPLEYLEESLAEGISVSHDDMTMPEFSFTPQTIADLLAYMDSLTKEASSN
ncbi:cytochrome c [Thalassospira sp. MA62]|nr:cytochrome c [Thalassospira sp. MA62]